MPTDQTTDTVTKEITIKTMQDMMDANAQLGAELVNDTKLSAMQKLRGFTLCVNNQVKLSRDAQARRAELVRYGMKLEGMNALSHDPFAEQAKTKT